MTGNYLLLFLLPIMSSATPYPAYQQALLNTLFSPDYNPLFIPVKNESVHHQEVFLEATLQKIIDFDMDKGIFTTLIWLDMSWEDDYLKWDNPFLVVEANGHVRWIPPLVLKTMCEASGSEHDTHTCELKFGSWVYNANQLDLISKISSMDLEGYTASNMWDLESASVERHETTYECCPEAFVDISYFIPFHSKSLWSLI